MRNLKGAAISGQEIYFPLLRQEICFDLPLWYAITKKCYSIISYLLNNGADPLADGFYEEEGSLWHEILHCTVKNSFFRYRNKILCK